jgi:ArsR family transcriptional regulator
LSISKFLDILASMKKATDPDVLLLQAAADPARLAILRQLSGNNSICACDFVDSCGVSQPTISHHLKVLRDCGWVTTERKGSWIWYSICPDAAARFREIAGGMNTGPALSASALGASQPVAAEAVELVMPGCDDCG